MIAEDGTSGGLGYREGAGGHALRGGSNDFADFREETQRNWAANAAAFFPGRLNRILDDVLNDMSDQVLITIGLHCCDR